jgi:hypothetical protein
MLKFSVGDFVWIQEALQATPDGQPSRTQWRRVKVVSAEESIRPPYLVKSGGSVDIAAYESELSSAPILCVGNTVAIDGITTNEDWKSSFMGKVIEAANPKYRVEVTHGKNAELRKIVWAEISANGHLTIVE